MTPETQRSAAIPYEVKRWVDCGPGGLAYLETRCAGSCREPHRVDERHPRFAEIRAALDAGDGRPISCYHRQGWRW